MCSAGHGGAGVQAVAAAAVLPGKLLSCASLAVHFCLPVLDLGLFSLQVRCRGGGLNQGGSAGWERVQVTMCLNRS